MAKNSFLIEVWCDQGHPPRGHVDTCTPEKNGGRRGASLQFLICSADRVHENITTLEEGGEVETPRSHKHCPVN